MREQNSIFILFDRFVTILGYFLTGPHLFLSIFFFTMLILLLLTFK